MTATACYFLTDQIEEFGAGLRINKRYLSTEFGNDWDILDQDNYAFVTADYVDQDISPERTEADRLRERITAALRDMQKLAPSWDNQETSVLPGSAAAAELFIASLPENRALPKVAADGDGDVMLVWEGGNECIITVDAKSLHLVSHPGQADAVHLAQPIRGAHIPVLILQHVPFK